MRGFVIDEKRPPSKRVGNTNEGPFVEQFKRGVLAIWNQRLLPTDPEYVKDWATWERRCEAHGSVVYED